MTAGGRSQTVTDTQIASPMPGDIHSMKHWKLSKIPTPESSPVIFQAKLCAQTGRKKTAESNQREVLADHAKLNASGLSWGCSIQRMHNDGKRFTVIADDKLTAFLELERVTRESLRFQNAE